MSTRVENRLLDLLNLCNVPRWVIVPRRREQSVAEHSFRVAVIAQELAALLNPAIKHGEVVLCALLHDAAESYTGDIPSSYKQDYGSNPTGYCPWLAEYPFEPEVARIVKLADTIEAMTWIRRNGGSSARTHMIELGYRQKILDLDLSENETAAIRAVMRLLEQE